jgi:hypothetical protein
MGNSNRLENYCKYYIDENVMRGGCVKIFRRPLEYECRARGSPCEDNSVPTFSCRYFQPE